MNVAKGPYTLRPCHGFSLPEAIIALGVSSIALVGGIALLKVGSSLWNHVSVRLPAATFGLPSSLPDIPGLPDPTPMNQARVLHAALLRLLPETTTAVVLPGPLQWEATRFMGNLNSTLNSHPDPLIPPPRNRLLWESHTPLVAANTCRLFAGDTVPADPAISTSQLGFSVVLLHKSAPFAAALLSYSQHPATPSPAPDTPVAHRVALFDAAGSEMARYQFFAPASAFPSLAPLLNSPAAFFAPVPTGGHAFRLMLPVPIRTDYEPLFAFSFLTHR